MANKVVSVILDSGITYVSGIVNGNEYVFTLTADNTWSAEVAVSDDNIYRLTLTAIDNLGNVSTVNTTLYYGLNLITDRTQGDVNRYLYLKSKNFSDMTEDEQREWLSDMKGAYNSTDLSRVDAAVEYLAKRLEEYGYHAEINTYKLWNMRSVPSLEQMTQYLDNIRAIRSAFTVLSTTPQVPNDMRGFDYRKANNIEQILFDVDYLITVMMKSWFFSNDIYAGEV